jgi:hypothetical protein
MPTSCDRCRLETELQLWIRVFPVQDRVRLCAECSEHVRSDVDERGLDGEDTQRLNTVASHLGGDVWRTGERVYWFRFPPGIRSAANGTNGHATNGNGANGNGGGPAPATTPATSVPPARRIP